MTGMGIGVVAGTQGQALRRSSGAWHKVELKALVAVRDE